MVVVNLFLVFDFDLFKRNATRDLANAVKSESKERINEVLRESAISPDIREPKYGHTLLMLAVANNLKKSVRYLLEAGADPNIRSNETEGDLTTPMFIACNHIYKKKICDLDVLELLIAYKGNVNDSLPMVFANANYTVTNRPLLEACKSGCLDIVKSLIEGGADINQYDYSEGVGLISYAIIFDNLEILKYLIIERKIKIPKYCCVIQAHNESPRVEKTIQESLMSKKYKDGSKEFRLREDILNYLKSKAQK
ncbi:ankyrin repeat domain-containing protein [uncultured Sphingobacterium sp.]|uniref:ankyrin repeat domain-containing protein n=1 Tax=uncultured Sphingobacterium sp. TaxID=182688 RepID=UPI0037486729